MSGYIGAPPITKKIPVTKGCDFSFTIQRIDADGDPINFDAGTAVYVWVDLDPAVKVNAVVSGSTAAVTIPDAVCDQVRNSTRWRAVIDQGDLEVPLLVGRFERNDG